jgi:hypothetical protein
MQRGSIVKANHGKTRKGNTTYEKNYDSYNNHKNNMLTQEKSCQLTQQVKLLKANTTMEK